MFPFVARDQARARRCLRCCSEKDLCDLGGDDAKR